MRVIFLFFDKDYSSDLVQLSNSDEIMKAIDRIREPIKQMNLANKQTATIYIQNLCKLTNVYVTI